MWSAAALLPMLASVLGRGASESARTSRSLQTRVTPDAPPLFLLHAQDDPAVPVAGAFELAGAYHKADRPVEAHFLPAGGHGFGLGLEDPRLRSWPDQLRVWLENLPS